MFLGPLAQLLNRHPENLVLHVDDLIEMGAEKVVMPRFRLLFWSHMIPRMEGL